MARKSSLVSVLGGFLIMLAWLMTYEGVSSSSCGSLPCLYYGNGNTLKAIEINSSKVHTVLTNLNSVEAVDVHIKLNLVYWSETRPNAIKRLNVSSGKVEDILTDSNLGEIDGLAVEWESDLIYWTDYTNERIEVAQLDGKNRQTLIAAGMRLPREIAVDPRKGYMFWISRGFQPRIYRATLSGDSKTTLVSFGSLWWLNRPNGITLDFSANRLYWVDSRLGRIESIDYNGNNRQRFTTLSFSSNSYDIVLYNGVFYYSDTNSQSIDKIDKATKQSLGSYTGLGASSVLRLAMFSPARQPKGSTACHNNGGCSHLCLLSPAGNQCACPAGEILKSDGKTCDDQGSSVGLLLADRTQQELYQIPLFPDSSASTTAIALPLNSVRSPQGVDFDPVKGYVYWSDGSRDVIFRALLNGSAQEQIVDQLRTPDGIAVDSVGRNLYWTDRRSNRIEVCKLDGSFRKILVYENLNDPVDIVLNMENGYMYWSEGTRGFNTPKIERADMDGTNRKVIITLSFSFLGSPNGLALDKEHNRLYYVVGRSNEISFVSLITNTRSTFLTRSSSFIYPKGVALYANYIYWTEGLGQTGAVYRADRVSGGNVKKIVDNLRGPEDICVYDANDTTQTVNSSCGINNGGCSHLCLLTPRGHQCACPNEMKLKTDKKNCHFSEFLLYADSSRQKIFLINLDSSQAQPTAVKLGNTPRPEALDYDPQERFIYWSDLQLRQILRAHPDGSAKAIIINNSLQSPKGLAVDHVGRNLYWTDFDANRIEVAKLNGSDRKVLVSQNIQKPMDIVLDLKNGLMYWSSWSNSQPTIERASMDGSMSKTLVQFSSSLWLARPNGLALDPENRRLYWVDTSKSVIQYTDLQQGNGAQVTLPVRSLYLFRAYGLALKENTIYWSTSGSIYSADKMTGDNVRRLAGSFSSPRDVHVYHNYTGIPDNHLCTLVNGWCTHLCLLKPGGYQCACPDNVAVGVSCKTTPLLPSSTVSSYLSPSPSLLPSPSPSSSPSSSPSPFPSTSPSSSPSPLPTPSPSPSPQPTPSLSLSSSPSPSLSPSSSPYSSYPSPSPSPLPSPSSSYLSSSSPSSSPSQSSSPSPSSSSSSSPSPSPSASPSSSPSPPSPSSPPLHFPKFYHGAFCCL